MSIKSKLLTTFILTNILTSILILLFFSSTANRIIDKNMAIQAEEIEASILRNVKMISSDIDHINYTLIMDGYDVLNESIKQPKIIIDSYESITLRSKLIDVVEPLYQFQHYLDGLAIYSETNRLMSFGIVNSKTELSMLGYVDATNYGIDYETTSFSITKDIKVGNQIIAKTVGYINIPEFLSDQLLNLPEGSHLSILDSEKNIIDETGKVHEKSKNLYNKTFFSKDGSVWFTLTLPKEPFLGALTKNLQLMIVICTSLVVVSTFSTMIILIKLTKRIEILNNAMEKVKNKDLTTHVVMSGKDEIKKMSDIFNSMVMNISELMNENKEQEIEKKEIEMDFLQAQINPHFLSNTLNSITWMADLQEASNISSLSKSLVTLLHSSMYKGDDLVTLAEELNHVKSYVTIQQVAYINNFELVIDIEDDLLNYKVLRFILQPLVENSILHNFTELEPLEEGKIIISAKKAETNLILSVVDNGNGITEDKLTKMIKNKPDKSSQYSKIGVKNIHKRIQLYFGDWYGLNYVSKVNEFTKVEIKLPIIGGEKSD